MQKDISKQRINYTCHASKNAFTFIGKLQPPKYNPGHNNLQLCNVLIQLKFTRSRMKLDI